MSVFDRHGPGAGPGPFWTETLVRPGRGDVGTGMFDRVFFVDVPQVAGAQVRVRTLKTPGGPALLSQVLSTGHEVALEEDRSATLLLPLSGSLFCATGRRDFVAVPGQAMVLTRGRRRTVTRGAEGQLFRALVLRMPELPAGSPLAGGGVLDLAKLPELAAAAGLLRAFGQPGGVPADAADDWLQGAAVMAGGVLAGLGPAEDAPRRPAGSARALLRAERLMRDHLAEDITIRDVAAGAGLSMRQLQHLFTSTHGLSPHAWLTRLRLEQAHLRLKAGVPAPSVTDAALSAGFAHLGRFPAIYRSRFGRLPSQERAALS